MTCIVRKLFVNTYLNKANKTNIMYLLFREIINDNYLDYNSFFLKHSKKKKEKKKKKQNKKITQKKVRKNKK